MDPADAAMVRAMGLRPNAMVRVCRQGDPTIIEVFSGGGGPADGPGMCSRPDCRCRLGLARVLAERVRVTLGPGQP